MAVPGPQHRSMSFPGALAEAGQLPPGGAEPCAASAPQLNDVMLKYVGLLAASQLQDEDPIYQHVRAFNEALAFLQGHLEMEFEHSWLELREAVDSKDYEKVPQLATKSVGKAFAFIKMTKGREFMAKLNRPRARDLKVFLNTVGFSRASEMGYPFNTRQWKTLLEPPRFADWARSIFMDKKKAWALKYLRFLVPSRGIIIGGMQKPLEDLGTIINVLETGTSLGASLFFGAPLVILASEIFVRWVNIVVLVVWVVIFLIFLIWWKIDSSYLFIYVLGYTTMLASVNVGGQLRGGWINC